MRAVYEDWVCILSAAVPGWPLQARLQSRLVVDRVYIRLGASTCVVHMRKAEFSSLVQVNRLAVTLVSFDLGCYSEG